MIEMKEIKSVLEKHKNILLMKEKRQNNKNDLVYIDTYYENDNIIRNYYTKKPVPSKIEIPNKNNKKDIRINIKCSKYSFKYIFLWIKSKYFIFG